MRGVAAAAAAAAAKFMCHKKYTCEYECKRQAGCQTGVIRRAGRP